MEEIIEEATEESRSISPNDVGMSQDEQAA